MCNCVPNAELLCGGRTMGGGALRPAPIACRAARTITAAAILYHNHLLEAVSGLLAGDTHRTCDHLKTPHSISQALISALKLKPLNPNQSAQLRTIGSMLEIYMPCNTSTALGCARGAAAA